MQTLSSLIAGYLETDEYEKQLSPDTIKAHRIDLRQFLDFTGGEWADKDMLNQYIKYLNQHFAPRSAKRKLASVRAFYHEMEICGEMKENPFDKLHIRIHSPQQLPRVIPEQVVQALLQSAYSAYTPTCQEVLRDIVVLELLFSTGLRVSELCALSKDTFLLNDSGLRLLVKGKGRKEPILQITTPELLQIVKTYYDVFSKEIQEQGVVLFSQRGRPLSPQSVRRIINKYLNRIGEFNHVTPHMFRYTFATLAIVQLRHGIDVEEIRKTFATAFFINPRRLRRNFMSI